MADDIAIYLASLWGLREVWGIFARYKLRKEFERLRDAAERLDKTLEKVK